MATAGPSRVGRTCVPHPGQQRWAIGLPPTVGQQEVRALPGDFTPEYVAFPHLETENLTLNPNARM